MKEKLTGVYLLLLVLAAIFNFSNVAKANPFLDYVQIPVPSDVVPPTISINGLKNNTAYPSNTLSLNLNVTLPVYVHQIYNVHITRVTYQRDWKDSIATIYLSGPSEKAIAEFSYNVTLKDIPEGAHNVTFVVSSDGSIVYGATLQYFGMTTTSTIYFTVDMTSPMVSILSHENGTYLTSDIPLNFTVDERVAKILYSVDGANNITITGNTTLNDLSVGVHNARVYVWDAAGNSAASETATFRVSEPEPEPEVYPTVPVVFAAVVVGVVLAGAGFLLIRKQGRGKTQ